VNIAILRAFARLRQMLATNRDSARRLEALERKYDAQFRLVHEVIKRLAIGRGERDEMGFNDRLKFPTTCLLASFQPNFTPRNANVTHVRQDRETR
jgi:hypothetical protein